MEQILVEPDQARLAKLRQQLEATAQGVISEPNGPGNDCAVHMRWALLLQEHLRAVNLQRNQEEQLCRSLFEQNKKMRSELAVRTPSHPLVQESVLERAATHHLRSSLATASACSTQAMSSSARRDGSAAEVVSETGASGVAASAGTKGGNSQVSTKYDDLLSTPNLRVLSNFLERDFETSKCDTSDTSKRAELAAQMPISSSGSQPSHFTSSVAVHSKFQRAKPCSSASFMSAFDSLSKKS
mmetsp:Transcript_370/g.661  ORF Transcript_370/g.661 Transcript_370/m.661 type:complete len:242 (+) Transcript_370:42-767(+)|eukprot:CAMPEP_0119314642 /NCGR_PEP_ID=MMETSP1333-20130426/33499_1 /TAXON_ID=418940 /ORGANISM="Scyphosphaera apsteinii, Strain RCC1455" /LENGTH=241 /DNA_ID=CAMNT_0007319795 /DNA_START=42 /DNA_END=767 /DNA_ORIENTATION=-